VAGQQAKRGGIMYGRYGFRCLITFFVTALLLITGQPAHCRGAAQLQSGRHAVAGQGVAVIGSFYRGQEAGSSSRDIRLKSSINVARRN